MKMKKFLTLGLAAIMAVSSTLKRQTVQLHLLMM